MNINQAFPSKWLSAPDIGQARPVVTIARVTEESIQQGEAAKPVIHFVGKQKGMVLNKTNAMNIATMYGPETDNWIGKSITLYTTFVDFSGRSVLAIRIEPTPPQVNTQNAQAPVTPPPAGLPPEGPDDSTDEIPW